MMKGWFIKVMISLVLRMLPSCSHHGETVRFERTAQAGFDAMCPEITAHPGLSGKCLKRFKSLIFVVFYSNIHLSR